MNPLNPYFDEISQIKINLNLDFKIRELSIFLGMDLKKVQLTRCLSCKFIIYFFYSLFCVFHDFISWVIQIRFHCIYFENYFLKQRDKTQAKSK